MIAVLSVLIISPPQNSFAARNVFSTDFSIFQIHNGHVSTSPPLLLLLSGTTNLLLLSGTTHGGNSIDVTSPIVESIDFSSISDGISIEGFGGRLASYSTNIPTQIMQTGKENQIQINVSDNNGKSAITRVVMNMFFEDDLFKKGDTYFMYNEKTRELTVSDPNGFFGDVKLQRIFTETEMILRFTFIPQKPMPITDLVINALDEFGNNMNTNVVGAFEIQGEPITSVEESTTSAQVPYYKNPEWNQFVIDSDGNMMTYDAFGNLDTKPMRVIVPPVYYGDQIGKSERHDDGFWDKVSAEESRAKEVASAIMAHPIYDEQKIFKTDKVFKYPSNVGKADRGDVKSMNDLKQKEHSKAMKLVKRMS